MKPNTNFISQAKKIYFLLIRFWLRADLAAEALWLLINWMKLDLISLQYNRRF